MVPPEWGTREGERSWQEGVGQVCSCILWSPLSSQGGFLGDLLPTSVLPSRVTVSQWAVGVTPSDPCCWSFASQENLLFLFYFPCFLSLYSLISVLVPDLQQLPRYDTCCLLAHGSLVSGRGSVLPGARTRTP